MNKQELETIILGYKVLYRNPNNIGHIIIVFRYNTRITLNL